MVHVPLSDPLTKGSRVLVRLPNALGDAIMATPALRRLSQILAPNQLTVTGLRTGLEVLASCPWFANSIEYDKKDYHSGVGGHLRYAKELSRHSFTHAIVLPNSLKTALHVFLARIPHRLGYFKEGRRILMTAGRPRNVTDEGVFVPKYTGTYFNELLDLIPGLPAGSHRPELFEDAVGRAEYEKWKAQCNLQDGDPYMIVVPGAAFGPSKIWVLERYAEVCNELAERFDVRVLISYGPGEEEIARSVKASLKTQALPDARVSLRGLKSVFKHATFVLTNDTGPRHLAVAFDIPNVTIMGPNDPRYTHLEGERGQVMREEVPCSPCQLKRCPLAEQICMTRLTSARVIGRCIEHWPA